MVKHLQELFLCPHELPHSLRHLCEHGKRKYDCVFCGKNYMCEHGQRKYSCKTCSHHRVCVHGSFRYTCKVCNLYTPKKRGNYITKNVGSPKPEGKYHNKQHLPCEHKKRISDCKTCNPKAFCGHGRRKRSCKLCKESMKEEPIFDLSGVDSWIEEGCLEMENMAVFASKGV